MARHRHLKHNVRMLYAVSKLFFILASFAVFVIPNDKLGLILGWIGMVVSLIFSSIASDTLEGISEDETHLDIHIDGKSDEEVEQLVDKAIKKILL